MKRLVAFVIVGAAALVVSASAALATDITNPADHPFPITVTVYGQTYHDGLDTLPGYDDYACTAIPGVTYDFANNKIEYSNGKVASWTEWDRIPGYEVWLQQQKQKPQQKPQQQQKPQEQQQTSSSSSSSSSSNSSSSSSPSSSLAANSSSATNSSSAANSRGGKLSGSFVVSKAKVSKAKVSKVSGAFTVKPTTTKAGKYKVTVATRSGLAKPTGKVTVKVKKGLTTKTLTGSLSGGSVIAFVPKLGKGTWSIAIAWSGDANYLAASAKGSLAVTK